MLCQRTYHPPIVTVDNAFPNHRSAGQRNLRFAVNEPARASKLPWVFLGAPFLYRRTRRLTQRPRMHQYSARDLLLKTTGSEHFDSSSQNPRLPFECCGEAEAEHYYRRRGPSADGLSGGAHGY